MVMLPGVRGKEAYMELLRVAREIKEKYNIRFDRDAHDPFEALVGILRGLDRLLEEQRARPKEMEFINAVVAEKGEITNEGVFVWPRHLKETAEELGIDWEKLKEDLRRLGALEFDRRRGKYRVKI